LQNVQPASSLFFCSFVQFSCAVNGRLPAVWVVFIEKPGNLLLTENCVRQGFWDLVSVVQQDSVVGVLPAGCFIDETDDLEREWNAGCFA
jgi:hypothetical protein